MSRWITIGIFAGLALLVAAPVALLAAVAVTDGTLPTTRANEIAATKEGVEADGAPLMVQRRLRVHAETGQPTGVEPVQQRLRQHRQADQDGFGMGSGWGRGPQHRNG